MNKPLVSVVMGAYNREKSIKKSVESILKQTYKNLEFIIVDDFSKDNTYDILKKIQQKDSRVKLFRNNSNKKVGFCLNKAISLSKGKYISIMDSDDVAFSDKIKLQVEYLEKNKDIDVLSTNAVSFGEYNIIRSIPNSDQIIKSIFLFSFYLINPTIIFKKKITYNLKYNPNYYRCQDYDFFLRVALLNYKFANVNKVLFKFKTYNYKKNKVKEGFLDGFYKSCQRKYLTKIFNYNFSKDELYFHYSLYDSNKKIDCDKLYFWFLKIRLLNNKSNFLDQNALKKVLIYKYLSLIKNKRIIINFWCYFYLFKIFFWNPIYFFKVVILKRM